MTIYAKSDGTTLLKHTEHVVVAMKSLALALLPDMTQEEMSAAIHGAVLHDLGKAHPFFQKQMEPGFDRTLHSFDVPHRHEISSLLFLPLFPRSEWPLLIDMVVGHHRSISALGGANGRGIIDLLNDYGAGGVFNRHSEAWNQWQTGAWEAIENSGVSAMCISENEAREAFDFACKYCRAKESGRNKWRGLMMSADHLASALQEETGLRVPHLFSRPDLSAFDARAADSDAELFPLSKITAISPERHTLLISPTGSGKTDFLLRRCAGDRVFYLLPFQASINSMFLRLDAILNVRDGRRLSREQITDIRRVHASAQIEIDDGIVEETSLQRHPGASIKVMTPHQAAAVVFGLAGHEAIALDLARQSIVLDEVHVYSEQCQAMVLALIEGLVRLGCRIHVGSATIPSVLASEIIDRLGGGANVYQVKLLPEQLQTYDRHIVHRLADDDEARQILRQKIADGKRILYVSNRVAAAQDRFLWAKDAFPGTPVLLVHSRFRRGDRADIENDIQRFDHMEGPCIVCSTQVIEVSLDISFDTIITDCAPIDSLIQRFGRVNRRRVRAVDLKLSPVYVISPPDEAPQCKPYELQTLTDTWRVLPNGTVLKETAIQPLVDQIYPEVDVSPIDAHLVEDGVKFKLRELCNFSKSMILDALDIDSACVIRISDFGDYRSSAGSERQKLEIPISLKALGRKAKVWRQIDSGNRPFVCPDDFYSGLLGLLLGEGREPTCTIL